MIFLQIMPFLLMFALYAAYLEAAGRILQYKGISWRRCFGLALAVGAITIAVNAVIMFTQLAVAPVATTLLGLAGQIVLGAYAFRSRGSTASGNTLQSYHGGLLTAVAIGLLLVTAFAILGVMHVLRP